MDRLSRPGRIGRPRPIRVRYLIVFAVAAYYFAFLSKEKRKWNKGLKKAYFYDLQRLLFRGSASEDIETSSYGFNYYIICVKVRSFNVYAQLHVSSGIWWLHTFYFRPFACGQWRFWRDCANAQACLGLISGRIYVIIV